MDLSKKRLIGKLLIYLYLVLFPLGQLIRIDSVLSVGRFTIQPIDLLAVISLVMVPLFGVKIRSELKIVLAFFIVATFSLALSLTYIPLSFLGISTAYLLRLVSYFSLLLLANASITSVKEKRSLMTMLIIALFVTAFIGWFQYLVLPDLRFMVLFGWDDHLNRLIGSLLDPGFTSVLMVFGSLSTLLIFLKRKSWIYLALSMFFVLTLAFTYSRAGYLALLVGLVAVAKLRKEYKAVGLVTAAFFVIVTLLPRGIGEGVRLERTFSITARFQSYYEALVVWTSSPVFGVGYNSYCLVKSALFPMTNTLSHSCSGSDSSLLLVLATTGVVGLMILIYIGVKLVKIVEKNIYGQVFISCFVALIVHSLFVNSLFYPWVMGWMVLILSISLRGEFKSE